MSLLGGTLDTDDRRIGRARAVRSISATRDGGQCVRAVRARAARARTAPRRRADLPLLMNNVRPGSLALSGHSFRIRPLGRLQVNCPSCREVALGFEAVPSCVDSPPRCVAPTRRRRANPRGVGSSQYLLMLLGQLVWASPMKSASWCIALADLALQRRESGALQLHQLQTVRPAAALWSPRCLLQDTCESRRSRLKQLFGLITCEDHRFDTPPERGRDQCSNEALW